MRVSTFILAATLVLPLAAEAQSDPCAELESLRALYDVRQVMMMSSPGSYEVNRRIDYHMDRLRGPLPGGGHRWVRWVRPAGDGPVVRREKLAQAAHDRGESETFEASGTMPYAVRIVVPRKRSVFRGNNDVWVGDVRIYYWVDGRRETIEQSVDAWLRPDNSRTFDLDVIADRAEVVVETATRERHRGEALVEVHFRQALAEDDPANPDAGGIQALQRLRYAAEPAVLDLEIAQIEQRVFPGIIATPFATLVARVREAERLLRSETEEEREKGEKVLADLVETLPR